MIKPLSKILPDCAKGFLSLCVRGGGGVPTCSCVCIHICAYWGSTYLCMCVCRVEVSSSASLKLTFQIQSLLLNPGLTAGLDTALLRSVYASPATSIEVQVHATMPIFYLGSENTILVHPMPQALLPLSHPDLCVAVGRP